MILPLYMIKKKLSTFFQNTIQRPKPIIRNPCISYPCYIPFCVYIHLPHLKKKISIMGLQTFNCRVLVYQTDDIRYYNFKPEYIRYASRSPMLGSNINIAM